MIECIYCQDWLSEERAEVGYDYCMLEECQKKGLNKSEREFRKEYTPALLHKSNYFWIKKSELKFLNVRSDLDNGV